MNLCIDCKNIVLDLAEGGLDQVKVARCSGNVSNDQDPVTGISRNPVLPLCSSVRRIHPDCPWFSLGSDPTAKNLVAESVQATLAVKK